MGGQTHPKALIFPLTGLRFFAAFAIVLHHIQGSFGVSPTAFQGWNLANGVTVFFVLSGFVLTYSYPALNEPGETRQFYIGRIARIFPAHLVTLLAAVALGVPFAAPYFLANALLLQSWFPTGEYFFSYNAVSWSISTEMSFYLVFPFLIRNFESTWPWKLAACFVASSAMGLLAWQLGLPFYSGGKDAVIQGIVMVNPVARVFEFCLGMTAALLWTRFRDRLAHLRFGTWAAVELIGVLLLIWGSGWINAILQPFMRSGAMQYWTAQTLSPVVPAALLLIILASSTGPLAKVLACRPVRFLGEISFAIYLTHQLVIRFFVMHPQILEGVSQRTAIGVFLITVLAASTALHLAEVPARRMIVGLFGRTLRTNAVTVDDHSLINQSQT
ncbi:acyltransferase family protein [Mesorhizobium sophorae]|uniref:acyltransferase family protein n=1 Tax=Mesorhizobium sophorae TaxID=1300294 RepID=UPI00142D5CA7|nr:acyltransferase [Mesorhizobium sophorae]